MSQVDLEKLSLEDLVYFEKNAKSLIKQKQREKLQEAYGKFQEIAKEYNTTVDEIAKVGKAVKNKRPIKYQDPANPKQGWSGQGRTPGWLMAYIEQGKKLEDFLVK